MKSLALSVVPELARGPAESPDCADCPLSEDGKPKKPVPGEGPYDPKWIAVGEGPGQVEVLRKRPFVGPSGRLLNKIIERIGADRDEIWVTNATNCQPRPGANLEDARECCKPRLEEELSKFPGRPILALGAVAAQTFLGPATKIMAVAGSLHDVDVDGTGPRPLIPTIHPAAILRGGGAGPKRDRALDLAIWDLTYDAGKVAALGDGKDIRFSEDIEIEVEDPDRALKLVEGIYEDLVRIGHGAMDVETDGLNVRTVHLTAIGIATPSRGVCVDYKLCTREVWRVIRALYSHAKIHLDFHNRQFDEGVLARYGLRPRREMRGDTLLKDHAAFPGAPHDLQRVMTRFFAIRPWKSDFRGGRGTPEELAEYCCLDTLGCARVSSVLDDCIEKTDSAKAYEIDNALAPIARRMTQVGIPLSLEENDKLAQQFFDVMDRTRGGIEKSARDPALREKFVDHLAFQMARKPRKDDPPDFPSRHAVRSKELMHGIRQKRDQTKFLKGKEPVEFSISNNDHIVAFLMARGRRWAKMTATGKYSADKEVLESMTHIPEVRTILEWREAAYLYSHFVKLRFPGDEAGGKGLLVEDDGRVHPSWSIHKITGRWGSEPNFQNFPKQNLKGRPNLRRQVIAPPGRKFVGADEAQLEARCIGMLSGDEFLCGTFMGALSCEDCFAIQAKKPDKFCPKHDIHTVFACEVFQGYLDKPSEDQKVLRDLTKRGEYGGFYGGSIETLYSTIVKEFSDVTLRDVANIVQIIAQRMPKVALWHQKLMRTAMETGEIRTAILGRRRAFPMGNIDPTILKNFPVQGLAGDIVSLAILRLEPELPETTELLLHGHDSVVLECDEDDAEYVRDVMTREMSHEYTVDDVRMVYPCIASIADSWADL